MTADAVLEFWFVTHGPDDWFSGSSHFDDAVAAQFSRIHAALSRGEGFSWRSSPRGRLAEIIVLDQFSRQLFRNGARAFASDGMALVLAQEAIAGGHQCALEPVEHQFLLMPYMHAESVVVHKEAMRLFTALGNKDILDFERAHFEVIKRFGRYPKRNAALGRTSTPQELEYLASRDGKMF